MKTSTNGLLSILHHEAIVLTRYKDSVGKWTISVGITAAAGADINPDTFTGELTLEQAIDLFRDVLKKYEDRVNKAVKRAMPQHVFDAFVSFDYNTGGIFRAAFVKSYNAGKPNRQVAREMMRWTKPKEITARRQAESDLFSSGKYGPLSATIYNANKSGRIDWKSGRTVKQKTLIALLKQGKPNVTVPEATGAGAGGAIVAVGVGLATAWQNGLWVLLSALGAALIAFIAFRIWKRRKDG